MKKLLDLFCGAGGATYGYQKAGFRVTGIDLAPQPHYCGDVFVQADALAYLAEHGSKFDVIHASPPCQGYSQMSDCRPGLCATYPKLIEPIRESLQQVARPWIIENVPRSPLRPDVVLCGQMFGLPLYRHRIFEAPFPVMQPPHPAHSLPGSRAGHWKPGHIISVCGNCSPISLAKAAMGIDWMNRNELAESIPPAYTEWIGRQLLTQL
jgi:DNA (cytosine-5)-methyltransferase 1